MISARRRNWDRLVVAVGITLLGIVFYRTAMLGSRVIDGTRYFWLDDDMMISMRYARNLADGQGLSWNPGDRIEGYTNFLWTLVMAAVHLARPSDAYASAIMKAINFVLAAASLRIGVSIIRAFAPRSLLAPAVLVLCFVTCSDVLYWAVWGFETTLLMFASLVFWWRLFTRGDDDVLGLVALATLPLIRGDAVHLFVTHAAVALVASKNRRKLAVRLALAALPTIGHLLFRRFYYGAWEPNTYDLKVYRVPEIHPRGFNYLRNFAIRYAVVIALAASTTLALVRRDRRVLGPIACVLGTMAYSYVVGGDLFPGFRFFGYAMPLLFAFAAAGDEVVAQRPLARLTWAVVIVVVNVPLHTPIHRLVFPDDNGDPERELPTALILKKHAKPTSSIVVLCAGVVPYFTHLRSLDMAGKSDRHIARLEAVPGALIGHGKIDAAYTLGQNPDLVVACSNSYSHVLSLPENMKTSDPLFRFVTAPEFRQRYLPYPILESFLLQETSVYTHQGSPEFAHRQWSRAEGSAPR